MLGRAAALILLHQATLAVRGEAALPLRRGRQGACAAVHRTLLGRRRGQALVVPKVVKRIRVIRAG